MDIGFANIKCTWTNQCKFFVFILDLNKIILSGDLSYTSGKKCINISEVKQAKLNSLLALMVDGWTSTLHSWPPV